MEPENDLIKQRLQKLKEIKEGGIQPYPFTYDQTHHANDLQKKYGSLKAEDHTTDAVKVAGRIMLLRRMGKVTFMKLRDFSGDIQLYFHEESLKKYAFLKKLDLGDFIGAQGTIFKTKTGELTIEVKEFSILSKAIRPLPEKFHGLHDPEQRYRKRYLDLATNPAIKEVFVKRAAIIRHVRNFLDQKGFVEVETPVLQPLYGGANARPFMTHHNTLNMDLYLKISPELYLKRLIIGGFEKVYDLSKNFRNEGIDHTHNPEFTMLECYQAYADYNTMMELCESLIKEVAVKVTGSLKVKAGDVEIDLGKKWERITMKDALKKYADIAFDSLEEEEMVALLRKERVEIPEQYTKGILMNLLFETFVEKKLIQPTFVLDYPIEICPLTKLHRTEKGMTERFELFINAKEWANAYSELNDPLDQRERLQKQEQERKTNEEAHPMDEDFVEAMEYGMPPTGGIGIGIDRLVMLLCGVDSIREVILFPTMKKKEE